MRKIVCIFYIVRREKKYFYIKNIKLEKYLNLYKDIFLSNIFCKHFENLVKLYNELVGKILIYIIHGAMNDTSG